LPRLPMRSIFGKGLVFIERHPALLSAALTASGQGRKSFFNE
jgi:hypothetical protein